MDCRRLRAGTAKAVHPYAGCERGLSVLILGVILLILGLLLGIPVLWTIGVVLAVVGAILMIADAAGSSWGRRWY